MFSCYCRSNRNQTYLMAPSVEDKKRVYDILLDLYTNMTQTVLDLALPSFKVNFNFTRIFSSNKPLHLHPQATFLQSPKLYLLPIITMYQNSVFNLENAQTLLREFVPFTNENYFLAYDASDEEIKETKRRKFSLTEDNLLFLAVKNSKKRDLIETARFWLKDRSSIEIRNRYKNLSCGRASFNPIKQYKNASEGPLTKEEFFLFVKGLQWFGCSAKFELISQYYLPYRSYTFLQK